MVRLIACLLIAAACAGCNRDAEKDKFKNLDRPSPAAEKNR
jgi:hypothetical protein